MNGEDSLVEELKSLADHWETFGLENKRIELDDQAAKIGEYKQESIKSRKVLSTQTKDFKGLSNEEKLQQFNSLLKLYQLEVDNLTRRSKYSESCYSSIYKSLQDAPDPLIGLKQAMNDLKHSSEVDQLEEDNKKLTLELQSIKKEAQGIKNQEVTMSRLEKQVKVYEQRLDDMLEEKIKEKEGKLMEEHQKSIFMFQDREKELQGQVYEAQGELAKLQRSYDDSQSQLLEIKIKYDNQLSASQAEMDILVNDLDRSRNKIVGLEQERDLLTTGNREAPTNNGLDVDSHDFELRLAQKDIQITQLNDQINKLEDNLESAKSNYKTQSKALNDELASERKTVEQLRTEIESLPNIKEYSIVKKELELLKAMEYEVNVENLSEKTVEQLLKEKNRHLETENVGLKAKEEKLLKEVASSKKKYLESETRVQEHEDLIAKLEEDISAGYKEEDKQDIATILTSGETADATTEDKSMIQIICSQRDRFKVRVLELEEESSKYRQHLEKTKAEMQETRGDNVKLYEKIKYLQSYGKLSSARKKHDKMAIDIESSSAGADHLESKYSDLYEDTVNPFVVFNRKEKYKRYSELKGHEKLLLKGGQFFLSSRWTRTFIFFYMVLLHILVFATLYKLAHIQVEIHNV